MFVDFLCDAFDRNELAILTWTALDQDLKAVVPDGTLRNVAVHLVEWAERNGRTVELVVAVRAARPGNPQVISFADPLLAAAGAGGARPEQRNAVVFQVGELQAA